MRIHGRLLRWELLLTAWLVLSGTSGLLTLDTFQGRLTVEIVPADQSIVPAPAVGDMVLVYGTWVRDQHLEVITWNEIHPAFYIHNNTTGVEGGGPECKMLDNVHDPDRLTILDPAQPCHWASGRVDVVFRASDGDWHIDMTLTQQYRGLVSPREPLVVIYYPTLMILLYMYAAALLLPYLIISALLPRRTFLGRWLRKIVYHSET